ncbi:hypothetical protein Tco_1256539 [Tanacetum coccineum]
MRGVDFKMQSLSDKTVYLSYSGLEEFKEPEAAKIQNQLGKLMCYAVMYMSQRIEETMEWNGHKSYGGRITGQRYTRSSESSNYSQQDQDNQDGIVMPIWKDASYFGDVAPRSIADAQIQDKDGLHNENDATKKSHDDSCLKDNGIAINIARPEINTGSREVSTASYFYVSLLILITSAPSLIIEPTFEPQPSPDAEYHVPSPNESPLHVVHSHGSDEGSLKLIELMNLVTKLSDRIGVLEDDLKRTKQTYSAAFTKLILRIKKLESKVKTGKARKRARVVLLEDEEDDSSK